MNLKVSFEDKAADKENKILKHRKLKFVKTNNEHL